MGKGPWQNAKSVVVANSVEVETTALPAPVEAFKARRPNKIMEAAETAIRPRERKPRKRKLPLLPGA